MPTLAPERRAPGPIVTGFAGRGFRIDGEATPGGVLLSPEWWRAIPPQDAALSLDLLRPLIALAPEFLLLGTGAALIRPDRALIAAVEAEGVGVEPMDSRAAARAWGVLRAEDRWIAAALLPLA
jgi:uncharacterized protein